MNDIFNVSAIILSNPDATQTATTVITSIVRIVGWGVAIYGVVLTIVSAIQYFANVNDPDNEMENKKVLRKLITGIIMMAAPAILALLGWESWIPTL